MPNGCCSMLSCSSLLCCVSQLFSNSWIADKYTLCVQSSRTNGEELWQWQPYAQGQCKQVSGDLNICLCCSSVVYGPHCSNQPIQLLPCVHLQPCQSGKQQSCTGWTFRSPGKVIKIDQNHTLPCPKCVTQFSCLPAVGACWKPHRSCSHEVDAAREAVDSTCSHAGSSCLAYCLRDVVVAAWKPVCCCSHEVHAARVEIDSGDAAVKDKPVQAEIRFVLLWAQH